MDDCSYFSSLTFWSFQLPFGSNEILLESLLCLPFKYDVYCKGKGPRSYIGPWALSENIDRSEEEQIIIRYS